MSRSNLTSRVRREVEGVIIPGARYVTDACFTKCGIGRELLAEGRAAGILKPKKPNEYSYYTGEELIALVEWKDEQVKNGRRAS